MPTSDVYLQIQFAMAQAEYAVAQAIGEQATYSNRSSPTVFVWVTPLREDASMDTVLKARYQSTLQEFIMPLQPSPSNQVFPPSSGIEVDDVIVWNGNTYKVNSFTDLKTNGGVFKVLCEQTEVKQVGLPG
jgi:hypothetical protein